jgi:hypothetical protein
MVDLRLSNAIMIMDVTGTLSYFFNKSNNFLKYNYLYKRHIIERLNRKA